MKQRALQQVEAKAPGCHEIIKDTMCMTYVDWHKEVGLLAKTDTNLQPCMQGSVTCVLVSHLELAPNVHFPCPAFLL